MENFRSIRLRFASLRTGFSIFDFRLRSKVGEVAHACRMCTLPERIACYPERSEGSLPLAWRLPLIRVPTEICVMRWVLSDSSLRSE
jgi:hypothetical protein